MFKLMIFFYNFTPKILFILYSLEKVIYSAFIWSYKVIINTKIDHNVWKKNDLIS